MNSYTGYDMVNTVLVNYCYY